MSEHPFIFRVVNHNGEGIYSSDNSAIPEGSPYRDNTPNRPGVPIDHTPDGTRLDRAILAVWPDALGWFSTTQPLFGFNSPEQARHWFDNPDDVKSWARQGVKVRVFKREAAKAIVEGRAQVVFVPKRGAHHVDLPVDVIWDKDPPDLLQEVSRLLA